MINEINTLFKYIGLLQLRCRHAATNLLTYLKGGRLEQTVDILFTKVTNLALISFSGKFPPHTRNTY